MTKEQVRELEIILFGFVKRVANDKNATAAEVEALAAVASVLAGLLA